ncbi:MAG: branched-chain amino acid ABC transporter permease [Firmicutes bacterium]|nr:branched-chain amino acid ABC transporter permease [Bacillota bacterium]
MFLQQLVNGLVVGSVYALAAVGYSMIYGVLGFSNFAHGELTMIAAFAAFFGVSLVNLPFFGSVAGGVLVAGCLAMLVEKVAYRPLRLRNAPKFYYFISACGVSTLLVNLTIVTIGAKFRSFPEEAVVETSLELGEIVISSIDLLTLVTALAGVVALELFLNYTRLGKAIRATAYDSDAAFLMGVNVDKICSYTFLLAGILAGFSGIFRGVKYTVHANMGLIILKAFITAIFGGLGSVPGAFLGAMLLGITETFVAGYVSTTYRDVFSFLLLIAVLLVRPTGLMGKPVDEKA